MNQGAALYPDCGCPPERHPLVVINGVCRNADCIDYGVHRRMLYSGDRCQWCGDEYTRLAVDPLKGAR